jgi:hypothetical protein
VYVSHYDCWVIGGLLGRVSPIAGVAGEWVGGRETNVCLKYSKPESKMDIPVEATIVPFASV